MLLAFVHGGYSYEVLLEGPLGRVPQMSFSSLLAAKHYVRTNHLDPPEGYRVLIREIETGLFAVVRSNNFGSFRDVEVVEYIAPESEENSVQWEKEGF